MTGDATLIARKQITQITQNHHGYSSPYMPPSSLLSPVEVN